MNKVNTLTPEELEQELKKDRAGEKETDDIYDDIFMEAVIHKIEKRRKKLQKVYPFYTQKYVAQKAGISISTYKNYLSGYNTGFTVRKMKKLTDVLNCKPSDFLD